MVNRAQASPAVHLTGLDMSEHDLVTQNDLLRQRLADAERTIAMLRAKTASKTPAPLTPARAQAEVRQARERFDLLVRLCPVAIAITTVGQGRFVTVNESYTHLFGFSRLELVDRLHSELKFWPNDAERDRFRDQVAATGSADRIEVTVLSQNGRSLQVVITSERIELDGEECHMSMIVDISGQKKSAEALFASEQKYRQIVATAREGIWMLDAESRTTFTNRYMEEILGYEPGEMLGKQPFDFMDAEGQASARTSLGRRSRGISEQLDLRYLRKDGKAVWALVNASSRMDESGAYEGALAMVTDITDRRQAQDELEATASLLRATLDATADGILVTGGSGQVRSCNRRFEELWRLTATIARSGDVEAAMAFVLDQVRNPEAFLARVHELDSNPDMASEDVLEFKDGRVIERISRPQLLTAGEKGRVWSFRDITEQRQLQARLISADRLSSMGSLAAGVAHEINNPLAYVVANLSILAEQMPRVMGHLGESRLQELAEIIDDTREGADRVRRIVRDLKAFSRSDDAETGPVDLQRLLEFLTNMAFNEIRHRARLVKDFGAGVPLVEGNEGRLGQVFLNLIVNAAQAIPAGAVARNEVRIVTRADHSGGAIVEVHDTGTGITSEQMEQLFAPFFTTKPIGEGTGLGLSISHGIVTALGGDITVTSTPGTGSIFRVTLPGAHAASVPAPKPKTTLSTARRGQVLVIDDDAKIATAIHRLLTRDHDVTVHMRGRQALDQLATGVRADVILCDLMMPEMSGMEVHTELARTNPYLADRMVFMTGGAFTAQARAFLDQVPNERLEKPFDTFSLRALVRRLVQLSEHPPG